jgi:hypothetical protein
MLRILDLFRRASLTQPSSQAAGSNWSEFLSI